MGNQCYIIKPKDDLSGVGQMIGPVLYEEGTICDFDRLLVFRIHHIHHVEFCGKLIYSGASSGIVLDIPIVHGELFYDYVKRLVTLFTNGVYNHFIQEGFRAKAETKAAEAEAAEAEDAEAEEMYEMISE